jgi:hypothetical protein
MKNSITISIALVMFLCGCGDSSEIKKVVRRHLTDPDSAKFGELIVGPDGNWACIEVNAKNRMGGYAGTQYAVLRKFSDEWDLQDISNSSYLCVPPPSSSQPPAVSRKS